MRFKTLFFVLCLMMTNFIIFPAFSFADGIDMDVIMRALVEKEQDSESKEMSIGDTHLKNKAYGLLQIRQPAVDDVNLRYGTNYRAEDCLGNKELSFWIFKKYIGMYATEKRLGNQPTFENIARIWNGGPNGFKKESTIKYWQDVQKLL